MPWSRHSAFPVVADGQTVGLVTVRRINQVPAGERGQTTVRDVACPLSDVARATPDEPVSDLLSSLTDCSEGRALVFDGGQLAGIVSPSDVSHALECLTRTPGSPAAMNAAMSSVKPGSPNRPPRGPAEVCRMSGLSDTASYAGAAFSPIRSMERRTMPLAMAFTNAT